MYLKEVGKKYHLMRTIYDPEKKRGRQETIAKIPHFCKSLDYVDKEEIKDLTEEEIADINAKLKAIDEKQQYDYSCARVSSVPYSMQDSAKALENSEVPLTEEEAAAMYHAWSKLKKQLRKRGYLAPKKGE